MGKVVKLQEAGRDRGKRSRGARGGSSRRRSKTALVLGGGGVTGGVSEMAAPRAIDLLSVNRTVNDFDIYVGTSAGSVVAALTANGVTPEQMMRVVNNQGPLPFHDLSRDMLLKPNWREWAIK